MPSPRQMERVRKFYQPFNQELARLLGDSAFLWRASPTSGVEPKALVV